MASGSPYSKVTRRMWNDARFRNLSAPPPNGQSLWLRLLTGPELSNIPGVIMAWEAGLAQAMRWPLEGFREAFGEAFREGLVKADWQVGLIWVPKAIRHNRPASPNVVTSWSKTWDIVPECELKAEIFQGLKAFLEALPKGFPKAFEAACPKPSPKPSPNQEQEQEQLREPLLPPLETIRPLHPSADGAFGSTVDSWAEGIRASTRGQMLPPRGAQARNLVEAFAAHRPPGADPNTWARETAKAYADANRGRTLAVPFFVDWLNSGRPTAPFAKGLAPVQTDGPSGRLWKVGQGE